MKKVVVLLLVLAAGRASAQTDDDEGDLIAMGGDYTPATWPVERTLQPVLLARGLKQGEVMLGVGAGTDPGQPVLLSPGVAVGISDKLTLLAAHTGGLCLGRAARCPVRYGGLRALARLGVADVPYKLHFALQGGLTLDDVDPFTVGAELGLVVKLRFGRVAVLIEPRVGIALNQRDVREREVLAVPLELELQAARRLALVALATVVGGVSDFGDSARLGVAAGGWWSARRSVDVGGLFGFDAVAGAGATSEARTLVLGARVRW